MAVITLPYGRKLDADEGSPFGNIFRKVLSDYDALTNTQYLPKEKEQALREATANASIKESEAKYSPQMQLAKLIQEQNLGRKTGIEADWLPRQNQADLDYKGAETNRINTMTPLEARLKEIEAKYKPQTLQADIDYKRMGGSRGGVGSKEENFFQNLVAKDNPHLKPEQVYEASNVLRDGGDTLSDGTKLNPLSPASRESFNRLVKGGTTAPVLTKGIQAKQSDAELDVLTDMANKDFKPYADTYAGYSPQQIKDSFKSDDVSQKNLGRFIASQAAQYEIAQIRNRIAGGEPGISATHELMGKSGQVIKTLFPKLSATAREEATKRMNEYLRKALSARNSVGTNPSELRSGNKSSEPNNDPFGIL